MLINRVMEMVEEATGIKTRTLLEA